ncbi:MAG: hypothetical protein ACI9GZ_004033 [Bacteroidia bacterium]|jgi:PBP1b-binding outer membrane lipoprotein LpoB
MKNTFSKLSMILFAVIMLSGCATLFGPKNHSLAFGTNPDGAEIYLNGARVGATPLTLQLTADQTYNIEFRKEGYKSITRTVNSKVGGGWIVLDILGGLVPIIVDAATGNWKKLDQSSVNAELIKNQQP